MCFKINVFVVVSHIGESYPEDERGHSRQGGYDPSTYQWVGFWFSVYTYIHLYSQKLIKNGYLFYAMHYIIVVYAPLVALLVAYIYICILGAVDAQVSAR